MILTESKTWGQAVAARMNRTKIEWVINQDGNQGYTWNPVTGCEHGCGYCYARKISRGDFKPRFHKNRLRQPMEIKKPSTFFVPSMGDLFGEWVPTEWIDAVLETVEKCPRHTFLLLTKNPDMYPFIRFPNNCFLGATVTGKGDSSRLGIMRKMGGFVSCEPLLGDISGFTLEGLNWIIIGSLNSNNKPVHASKGGTHREWVTELIKQAHGTIPIFIKDSLYELYPNLPRYRELPYLRSPHVFGSG